MLQYRTISKIIDNTSERSSVVLPRERWMKRFSSNSQEKARFYSSVPKFTLIKSEDNYSDSEDFNDRFEKENPRDKIIRNMKYVSSFKYCL